MCKSSEGLCFVALVVRCADTCGRFGLRQAEIEWHVCGSPTVPVMQHHHHSSEHYVSFELSKDLHSTSSCVDPMLQPSLGQAINNE